MAWLCGACAGVESPKLKEIMNHIKREHFEKERRFQMLCCIDGCNRMYTKYASWYKHVSKVHSDYYYERRSANKMVIGLMEIHQDSEEEAVESDKGSTVQDTFDIQGLESMEIQEEIESVEMEIDDEIEEEFQGESYYEQTDKMDQKAALWLLGMKKRHTLTQKAIDDIVKGSEEMIFAMAEHMQSTIKERISRDISITNQKAVHYHMEKSLKYLHNPLTNLQTAYRQKKFVRKNWNYVDARITVMGTHEKIQTIFNQERSVIVEDIYYHVPIINSLKQFLQNKCILDMVCKEKQQAPEGFLMNFQDGSIWKEHAVLSQIGRTDANEQILALQIYYDDIEVCNPLGGNKKNIAMFYYRLANVDGMHISMLPAMRLIGAAETKYLKKYGIDKILDQIVADLKELHEVGFELEVDGNTVNFKGALHMILGDTPAAASMGGFKEGVGFAKCKCRMCICFNEDMQKKFREEDFKVMNLRQYNMKCRDLKEAPTKELRARFSTDYGINRKSHIARCPEFDITQCVPMDIMHVMFEGVVEYETKCVLKECIEKKLFDMSQFQKEVDMHFAQFRTESFDKPNPISTNLVKSNDNKLHQSATKMQTLSRAMPFLLGKLLVRGDTLLKFIADLLEISHMMQAPVISQNRLEKMKNDIQNHLIHFKELFPEKNIMPKQHYMLHIPRNISQFGPASKFSTSRFESEHRRHKRRIVHNMNYKNVAYSIVDACQSDDAITAEITGENHVLFSKDLVVGHCVAAKDDVLRYFNASINNFYNVDIQKIISVECTKFATVCGNKYVAGYSFVASSVHDDKLQFGKVVRIFLVKMHDTPNYNTVIVQLEIQRSLFFSQKLQAYQIQEDPTVLNKLQQVDDMADYSSYYACMYKRRRYIPVLFFVEDLIKLVKQGDNKKHNQLNCRIRPK